MRGNVRKKNLRNVFLPHRETLSGNFFIQGICISSWPLTVHIRAVSFGMFVEVYIKLWSKCVGEGIFSKS